MTYNIEHFQEWLDAQSLDTMSRHVEYDRFGWFCLGEWYA